MHAPLKSTDEHGVTQHALASGPWAWIILTAPYAFVTGARYFSRRALTRGEQESVYAEITQLMRNLHVVEKEIPPTYEDYLARFDEIIEHTLVAHPTAFEFLAVSRSVPPPPWLARLLWPLWRVAAFVPGRLQHFVIVGTLPDAARTKLGLSWTAADERKLRLLGRLVAGVVPVLPERIRYFPIRLPCPQSPPRQRITPPIPGPPPDLTVTRCQQADSEPIRPPRPATNPCLRSRTASVGR